MGLAGVGLLARPARAQAQAAIDPVPPGGWDYPTVVELLPFGHGVASRPWRLVWPCASAGGAERPAPIHRSIPCSRVGADCAW